MLPLRKMPTAARAGIKILLSDIDDTLTTDGRLTAAAYGAMERLRDAGLLVIPVTGRPAGWCDHMARMWPIDGIVGENGAFYFRYDHDAHIMQRHYAKTTAERAADRTRLDALKAQILAEVPGAGIAGDQAYREADPAIDFCEDIPALHGTAVDRIVAIFEAAGATAKVSSIHVNGWFGSYDKLSMTRILMRNCFNIDIEAERKRIVFAGDSPNDAPMFGFFPHSVGVANVGEFTGQLAAEPTYITQYRSGDGFTELADFLLA